MSIFKRIKASLTGDSTPVAGPMVQGSDWLNGAPRLTIRKDGGLAVHTEAAQSFAEALARGDAAIVKLVEEVRENGIGEGYIQVSDNLRYWIAGFENGGVIELIGRDATLQEQVTDALIESRSLLQNLLGTAADFAFELDENGRFSFVFPRDLFGQETADWIGENPTGTFWPNDSDGPARSPFLSKKAQTFEAIRIPIADKATYFDFDVEPILDGDGAPTGRLRGTARDVTESAIVDRTEKMARLGQTIQTRLTSMLIEADSAGDLLDKAANALMATLRADGAYFVTARGRDVMPVAVAGELPETPLVRAQLDGATQTVNHVDHGGRDLLLMPLKSDDEEKGAAVIHRDTAISPWSKEEEDLLSVIQASVSAAYDKAQMFDQLTELANLDGLTGLLNRRAFEERVTRRLSQSRQDSCALIFIDLDNFKEVNDSLGHQAGDDALTMVADHLKSIIRPRDMAGRFGGDEFVVWLEGVRKDAAAAKGRSLIAFMPEIRTRLGKPALQLNASVGICAIQPYHEVSLANLAEKADLALYDVKRAGKAGIAFADVVSDTISHEKKEAKTG